MIKADRKKLQISRLEDAIEEFFQVSLIGTKFLLLKLKKLATCYEALPNPEIVDFFWESKNEALVEIDSFQKNFIPDPLHGQRIVVPYKNAEGEKMVCILFFDAEKSSQIEYSFWEPYYRFAEDFCYQFFIPTEVKPQHRSLV